MKMPEVYMNGSNSSEDELFSPDDLNLDLSVLLAKMGVGEEKINEIFDVINRIDDPLAEPEPEPEPEPDPEAEEKDD